MAAPSPIDDLLKQAAAATGPPGATPTGTGGWSTAAPVMNVYLGRNDDEFSSPFAGKQVGETDRLPSNQAATDRIADVDTAAGQIYGWSDKRLKSWEQLLLSNGIIEPGSYDFTDLVSIWGSAVTEAGNLYTIGGKKITPEDFIELYTGANGTGGKGSATGGPTTTTSSNTSTEHFDDLDARAMANEAFGSALGKNATGKQAQALQSALNAYAKAHPQVSTSTTRNDGEGNTTTSSKSRGGISAQGVGQIAQDAAKKAPGYGEFQAASTYFNSLMDAIGATAPNV